MTGKKQDLASFTARWTAVHPMPPLQHAIYHVQKAGFRPILTLLKTGAALDAVDAHGATALHQAVFDERPDIYALLVQAGAGPDIANGAGSTAASFFEQYYGPFADSYWGVGIDA